MSIEPCPLERTNLSLLSQFGSCGLCCKWCRHSTSAISAIPMGAPGWPDLACSMASAARILIAAVFLLCKKSVFMVKLTVGVVFYIRIQGASIIASKWGKSIGNLYQFMNGIFREKNHTWLRCEKPPIYFLVPTLETVAELEILTTVIPNESGNPSLEAFRVFRPKQAIKGFRVVCKLIKTHVWIPAFAGMTTIFEFCNSLVRARGENHCLSLNRFRVVRHPRRRGQGVQIDSANKPEWPLRGDCFPFNKLRVRNQESKIRVLQQSFEKGGKPPQLYSATASIMSVRSSSRKNWHLQLDIFP